MADRTSASVFGTIFELLAEKPDERNRTLARRIWPLRGEYDFSDYQMGCDEALLALGLAKRGVHPKYPEDGETLLYLGDGFEEEGPMAEDTRGSLPLSKMLQDANTVQALLDRGIETFLGPAAELLGDLCCHVQSLVAELETRTEQNQRLLKALWEIECMSGPTTAGRARKVAREAREGS